MAGQRIRDLRISRDLKQADLARACGISASYLNLIEHGKRPVGGKLLSDLAAVLEVPLSALSGQSRRDLEAGLSTLAEQAGRDLRPPPEVERADDMAARYPGWSGLILALGERIGAQDRRLLRLTNRLAHDPQFGASLHDILSTVTAIRAAAGILRSEEPVEAEWQRRFHRNIHEDATRLAEAAQGLVDYLGDAGAGDGPSQAATPAEVLGDWLTGRSYHVAELEAGGAVGDLLAAEFAGAGPVARAHAGAGLARYRADAERLGLAGLRAAAAQHGADPVAIAAGLGQPLALVMRRLACLPELGAGLVGCDASGAFTHFQPADDFALPRFGGACPILPLFDALRRPGEPVVMTIRQEGAGRPAFRTWSLAEITYPGGYGAEPVVEAAMLMLRADGGGAQAARICGSACRLCPRAACPARREPAVVALSG